LNPARLELAGFARDRGQVSSSDAVSLYPRLAAELEGVLDGTRIHWTGRGEPRTDAEGRTVPWLHLDIRAELPLCCQRCLEPMSVTLDLDRSFRFVENEATAEREDEESDEDVLVFEPRFDLRTLVEDELLMALPMIPMHESCSPGAGKLMGQEGPAAEPRRHPFAALERLKR
jgi:uncharacterized protein